MESPLSAIPIGSRRRLAVTLGLFFVLFVGVGAVAASGTGTAAMVFSVIAFVVAGLLALLAWGVHRSVRNDVAEQRLDAAIEQTVAAHRGHDAMCGHDHDPGEMQVRDAAPPAGDACAHEGRGGSCTRDCDSCLLAATRPLPSQTG